MNVNYLIMSDHGYRMICTLIKHYLDEIAGSEFLEI